MGTETTSTEPLNIVVNESDKRSRKCNQLYTGDKSSNLMALKRHNINEAQIEKTHLL